MAPPDLLKLQLFQVIGGEVREVVGSTLELIDCRVLDLHLTVGVESLEIWLVSGTFSLLEQT